MNKKSIIIVSFILAFVVLLFVLRTDKKPVPSTSDIAPNGSSVQGEFLGTLISLNTLELDTKIVDSELFKSLVPSPALVNLNPDKGRVDPFMVPGIDAASPVLDTNPVPNNTPVRDINLGQDAAKNITISRITSTTAFATITGFSPEENMSLTLIDASGKEVNYREFTFKSTTQEFSRALTGLASKMTYTASVRDSTNTEIINTTFTTK